VLIGYRVAEDKTVRMPMALAMDGAFLTHSQHMVKIPSLAAAKKFLPPYDLAERRLHPDNPISVAPQVNEDWVMGDPPAKLGGGQARPRRHQGSI
jgi:pyruvate ferredoxin oxidoreductase alpha subunit